MTSEPRSGPDAIERCDGSIRCPASEHVEGCFTGEGHPDALRALRAPSEEAHLREQLAEAVAEIERLKIENALFKEALTVHGLPWVARSVERRMADRLAAERGQ
jgi:hypothetical protein